MSDLFSNLGVKIPDLVAGFAGGVVNALLFQRTDPVAALVSVVVGGLTANYAAATFSKMSGLEIGFAGFIVGLGAMVICQGLLAGVKKWAPLGKENDNAS